MVQTQISREEREIKHFESLANDRNYAWWGANTPSYKIRIERRVNLLKELLNVKPAEKLLECGCASGDFTKNIRDALSEKVDIYALDISESQIKVASQKLQKPNVYFVAGSIKKLDFEDGFFDCVVGNAILHHLDIEDSLREIKRVLKHGGKLLFFEPNMLNPHIWLSLNIPFLRKLYQASPDETAFYRWDLKRRLKSIGFRNVMIKPFDFIYPLIPKSFLEIAKKIESVLEKTFVNEIAGSLIVLAEK